MKVRRLASLTVGYILLEIFCGFGSVGFRLWCRGEKNKNSFENKGNVGTVCNNFRDAFLQWLMFLDAIIQNL